MKATRILRKGLIGMGVVGVVLASIVASGPPTFHVERSVVIAAPRDVAFARVNDLRAWQSWSPYEKLDPAMKRTFTGAEAGVGARYAWVANDRVGTGSMTVVESDAPSRVEIDLEFVKPFACENRVVFTFREAAGRTEVTWSMDAQNNFIGKALHLVMDMDKMVGADFERGLAALKQEAESAALGLDELRCEGEVHIDVLGPSYANVVEVHQVMGG